MAKNILIMSEYVLSENSKHSHVVTLRFACQLSFHVTENFTSSSCQIRPQSSDTFQHSH